MEFSDSGNLEKPTCFGDFAIYDFGADDPGYTNLVASVLGFDLVNNMIDFEKVQLVRLRKLIEGISDGDERNEALEIVHRMIENRIGVKIACDVCGEGTSVGALFRINEFGLKGIFRHQNYGIPDDPGVKLIKDILEKHS